MTRDVPIRPQAHGKAATMIWTLMRLMSGPGSGTGGLRLKGSFFNFGKTGIEQQIAGRRCGVRTVEGKDKAKATAREKSKDKNKC